MTIDKIIEITERKKLEAERKFNLTSHFGVTEVYIEQEKECQWLDKVLFCLKNYRNSGGNGKSKKRKVTKTKMD